jgi:hypothetical protein
MPKNEHSIVVYQLYCLMEQVKGIILPFVSQLLLSFPMPEIQKHQLIRRCK